MSIKYIVFTCFLSFLTPLLVSAQTLHNDYQGTYRAQVLEVVGEEIKEIPGTDTKHLHQTLDIRVLSGPLEDQGLTIENDYIELEAGDKFYFNHNIYVDGSEYYTVVNIDRSSALLFLLGLFVFVVIAFGGRQGVRSLVALGVSFLMIVYVLLPGLLAGLSPLLLSFAVAAGVLFGAIFFTHGFNREAAVAYGGTMLTVLLTSVIAYFAVHGSDLSGFAADESVYLNFNTQGTLDFTALLLGAIIIGVLGVLDDIAITQAAVVTELYQSNKSITRKEVYMRALRVGREHVGALINTLVLAYAGASLPLLMYFYLSPANTVSLINTELFATEIVRTIVGSIGLVLTVPIVTALAVYFLKGYDAKHGHAHACGHVH